jgi:flagellar basal body-associated protein FliL
MWNKATDAEESFRNKAIWWSATAVVVLIIGIGAYYRYYAQSATPAKVEEKRPPPPPPAVKADDGGIQHPIPGAGTDASALPALNQSDVIVRDSLAGLFGSKAVDQFIVPENVIRHIVVTVDNLPRKKVAVDLRPIKATPGETAISNQGDATTLSMSNYARYAPFVHLVQTTDPKTLAAVYFHLYPLFQQAYEDLGYPGRFFNDRLVEVIDHLLAAPEPQGPLELVQPKVFYQYADPKLEDLSAGQKLMIRMGPANERDMKAKLRELRAELVRSPAAAGATPQGPAPSGRAPNPAPAGPPPR